VVVEPFVGFANLLTGLDRWLCGDIGSAVRDYRNRRGPA